MPARIGASERVPAIAEGANSDHDDHDDRYIPYIVVARHVPIAACGGVGTDGHTATHPTAAHSLAVMDTMDTNAPRSAVAALTASKRERWQAGVGSVMPRG